MSPFRRLVPIAAGLILVAALAGPASAVALHAHATFVDSSGATVGWATLVEDGTGTSAQIPGYQVAGKTGTALKPSPTGGYYSDRYVASFIGFLPAGNPRIVVAAILDEPATVYGGVAAAPLFQQVARYAIQRLGIPTAPPVAPPPHVLGRP